MNSTISRRAFAMRCAAGAIATGILGRRARAADDSAPTAPASRYIDVHTHIGHVWNAMPELSVEGLLKWMDASDIAKAVVLPLVSPESSSYPIPTDFVLEKTKPYRERLIPFCSIDPRTAYAGGFKGCHFSIEVQGRFKDGHG